MFIVKIVADCYERLVIGNLGKDATLSFEQLLELIASDNLNRKWAKNNKTYSIKHDMIGKNDNIAHTNNDKFN